MAKVDVSGPQNNKTEMGGSSVNLPSGLTCGQWSTIVQGILKFPEMHTAEHIKESKTFAGVHGE